MADANKPGNNDLGASPITDAVPIEAASELPGFLVPYLKTLHVSPIGELVRNSSWVYPGLETAHVIGLGLLFGGIFMLDLRLLGLNKSLSVAVLSRHVLPWVWAGFVINFVSGIMLFASDALSLAANISFQLKMLMLMLAGANAGLFQLSFGRDIGRWHNEAPAPIGAKLVAIFSIAAWLAIITLGRMIAYWA